MLATHRVKNSDNDTVGFIIGNKFYNNYYASRYITSIDNLSMTKSGNFRAKFELPIVKYLDISKSIAKDIINKNPFKRDIQLDFKRWKDSGAKQVLRLLGPRQSGKTTELKKFAYSDYENVIYINLADDKYGFLNMLENRQSNLEWMHSIIESYCLVANLPKLLNNRKTILIIDEIQISAKCYNSIRDLRAEYNFDMIVTGSYLAITYIKKEYFPPAGTIADMNILPLSFAEFCDIFNKRKTLESVNIFNEIATEQHKEIDKLYEIYRQIGGYPEVVKNYINTGNIIDAQNTIKTLIYLFKNESAVYFSTPRQVDIFNAIFKQAIVQMCSGNKNYNIRPFEKITDVVTKETKLFASRKEIDTSINWLVFSKIIGLCHQSIDGKLANIQIGKRIYYLDCGIANYLMLTSSGLDKSNIQGVLTETFAYNELYKLHNSNEVFNKVKGDTPTFSTLGQYELDFIEEGMDDRIYGVEIKTKDGDPKSLKVYISRGLVDRGIVAKRTAGHKGEKIDMIPIWAVGCRFPYNI